MLLKSRFGGLSLAGNTRDVFIRVSQIEIKLSFCPLRKLTVRRFFIPYRRSNGCG